MIRKVRSRKLQVHPGPRLGSRPCHRPHRRERKRQEQYPGGDRAGVGRRAGQTGQRVPYFQRHPGDRDALHALGVREIPHAARSHPDFIPERQRAGHQEDSRIPRIDQDLGSRRRRSRIRLRTIGGQDGVISQMEADAPLRVREVARRSEARISLRKRRLPPKSCSVCILKS